MPVIKKRIKGPPSALSQELNGVILPSTSKRRETPLWRGPQEDGVTFSLLSRFLVCRERFRLHIVEGLQAAERFSAPLHFGNMWHCCEEAHAGNRDWETALAQHVGELRARLPFDQEPILHWYSVAQELFPSYVTHWAKHPDVRDRTPLLQEQSFSVPYKLPSGRTVTLRGKWDSVDLIGRGKAASVYIQENKTKSQINGPKIARQLTFDLQTMIYVVALLEWDAPPDNLEWPGKGGWEGQLKESCIPVQGARYNVIRRSAHKSVESMMAKLEEDRDAGRIGEWFARWRVEITPEDVARFRQECLDPILEQLCDWWTWVKDGQDPFRRSVGYLVRESPGLHWRHPFGVYNVLDEGGSSDLDEHLATGSEAGLRRVEDLYPELK